MGSVPVCVAAAVVAAVAAAPAAAASRPQRRRGRPRGMPVVSPHLRGRCVEDVLRARAASGPGRARVATTTRVAAEAARGPPLLRALARPRMLHARRVGHMGRLNTAHGAVDQRGPLPAVHAADVRLLHSDLGRGALVQQGARRAARAGKRADDSAQQGHVRERHARAQRARWRPPRARECSSLRGQGRRVQEVAGQLARCGNRCGRDSRWAGAGARGGWRSDSMCSRVRRRRITSPQAQPVRAHAARRCSGHRGAHGLLVVLHRAAGDPGCTHERRRALLMAALGHAARLPDRRAHDGHRDGLFVRCPRVRDAYVRLSVQSLCRAGNVGVGCSRWAHGVHLVHGLPWSGPAAHLALPRHLR